MFELGIGSMSAAKPTAAGLGFKRGFSAWTSFHWPLSSSLSSVEPSARESSTTHPDAEKLSGSGALKSDRKKSVVRVQLRPSMISTIHHKI